MILLQALWWDYDDFSFIRLRAVVGQTATVSSFFFLHLVGCCFLGLVSHCVRERFDGRVLTICVFLPGEWDLQIVMESKVGDIPWCIDY
jgi:hypothetical protein